MSADLKELTNERRRPLGRRRSGDEQRRGNVWDDVPDWGGGVGARPVVRAEANGDFLPFPTGLEGGHQIRNDTDEVARVLTVAAHSDPAVAEYPSSAKVAAIVHGEHRYHRVADVVEHAGPE